MGDRVGDTTAPWLYLTRESAVGVADELNDYLARQQDKVEKLLAEVEAVVALLPMET